MTTIIDGKKVAEEIRAELKNKIDWLRSLNLRVPGLVTIMVGDNPASYSYVTSKGKACNAIGMLSKIEKLPADIPEDALLDLIGYYNSNDNYHGILVQLPLPRHINKDKVIEKFYALIEKALTPRKKRLKTKPTKASVEKRLETKRVQAKTKINRKDVDL